MSKLAAFLAAIVLLVLDSHGGIGVNAKKADNGASQMYTKRMKKKSKKAKATDARDFSWLIGHWRFCELQESLFIVDGNPLFYPTRTDVCGKTASIIEPLNNLGGSKKNIKFVMTHIWPEPCVGLGLSDADCPTSSGPVPDGCIDPEFDHVLNRPGMTAVRVKSYGVVSLNPRETETINFFGDHSEFLAVSGSNNDTAPCEWKNSVDEGLQDLDQYVVAKGDDEGNSLFRETHAQEIRKSFLGNNSTSALNIIFQHWLVKDMQHCTGSCGMEAN